jgi:hypothetical protein
MSEIVFRGSERDKLIDEEIIHRRKRGELPNETITELNISRQDYQYRVRRLIRWGMIRPL